MSRVKIDLDSVEITWECPECSRKVVGPLSDTGDGWPLCCDCDEGMEYHLQGTAELWKEGKV